MTANPVSGHGAKAISAIDLNRWFHGTDKDRSAVRAQMDTTLQNAGFMMITGHKVPLELRAQIRSVARKFFTQPRQVKARYLVESVCMRGWMPVGLDVASYREGVDPPGNLYENFAVGAEEPTGDPVTDSMWFVPNIWPDEAPELRALLTEYIGMMRKLVDDLFVMAAGALGLPSDFFIQHMDQPTYQMLINRYPPLREVGTALPGQFRISPHTDFNTLTILDRQPGVGGLQVEISGGRWENAPYATDAFIVNVGDTLSCWTGSRWRSARHRVLPPDASAPDEDLMSLAFFGMLNPNALVTPLKPPLGRIDYEPLPASHYLVRDAHSLHALSQAWSRYYESYAKDLRDRQLRGATTAGSDVRRSTAHDRRGV